MAFEFADHRRVALGAAAAILAGTILAACGSDSGGKGPTPSLLLSQAHFKRTVGANGKPDASPLPARLVVLREVKGTWVPEVMEDPDSNVFHKAVFIAEGNGLGLLAGILSIGANKAALVVETFDKRTVKELVVATIDGDDGPSLLAAAEADLSTRNDDETVDGKTLLRRYRLRDGRYTGETVFVTPDRLCRFLNAGDVDGDRKVEIVASTHCQGVWVLHPGPGEWTSEIVDPDSGGFGHASALADLDGAGVAEIHVAAVKQRQIRRHRIEKGRWLHDTLQRVQPAVIDFYLDAARF